MKFDYKTGKFMDWLLTKMTPSRVYFAERSIELFFLLVCIGCAIFGAVSIVNGWYWLAALCFIIMICTWPCECEIQVDAETKQDLPSDDSKR